MPGFPHLLGSHSQGPLWVGECTGQLDLTEHVQADHGVPPKVPVDPSHHHHSLNNLWTDFQVSWFCAMVTCKVKSLRFTCGLDVLAASSGCGLFHHADMPQFANSFSLRQTSVLFPGLGSCE